MAIPRLVRDTAPGDRGRARIVGDRLAFVLETLHVHHTSEDVLLWPLLLDRAAPSADLVHTMEQPHQGRRPRSDPRRWAVTDRR